MRQAVPIRYQVAASTWLILVTGLLFAVGVGLLALGIWFELPGALAAYGDPTASWPIGVQVLLGAVAFGTWWRVNRRKPRPFTVVLLSMGIAVVLVLATAAYAKCPEVGQSERWSVVTRVIGLITNNYSTETFGEGCTLKAPPLGLQFARLMQMVVLVVAATSAVQLLLRNQLDRLGVRFSRAVSLVVGADEPSSALLPALAAGSHGQTLAVLTPDPAAPWLGRARAAGWRVVVGEAENAAALRSLLIMGGGRRALHNLAVLAPDATAAQRLVSSVERAIAGTKGREPVRVLVRMDDAWQAEDWRRRYLGRTAEWIVDTISENEVTARLLVEDVLSRGADVLLVAGHSDLTFALLAEMAQQARERALLGSGGVPPIVLVDPKGQNLLEEHSLAQRRFGNTETIEVTVRADTPLDDVVDEVMAGAADAGAQPAVLFTGAVDPVDQRLAARLGATYPDLPVYTRRTEIAGLGAEPLLAQVRGYGTTLDAGGGRPVDSWERIARLSHERYIRKYPDPEVASRRPWDELHPFYRESNVRQVLTVMRSAVAVGRSWGASNLDAEPPTEEQLDEMARTEQDSWVAHLTKNGWRWGEKRNDEARTNPHLLPWDELSTEGKERTRSVVTSALELLATLGYRSFDDPAAHWRQYRRSGEVTAEQRSADWSWTISDGTRLQATAGDWEVRDESGSRSVRADIFELTHEQIQGNRYRRIGEVDARPAIPGEVVASLEGETTAGEDQWVVRGVAGEEWVVPSAHFARTYELIEE